ncbi:MAG: hypothetical protein VXZ72_00020 [Chlamydiota bacterium]|nr:hypothetical protein [Chlamydiota bacterium]
MRHLEYHDTYDLILMEKAAEWEMYKEAQKVRRAKLAPGSKQSPFPKGSLNQMFRAQGNRMPTAMARNMRGAVESVRGLNRAAGGNLVIRASADPNKRAFGFRGRKMMDKKGAEALLKRLGLTPADLKNNPIQAMRRMQGTPLANMDPKEALDLIFPKINKPKRTAPKASAPRAVAPRASAGGGGSASKSLMKNPYVLGSLAAGGLAAAYLGTRKKNRR